MNREREWTSLDRRILAFVVIALVAITFLARPTAYIAWGANASSRLQQGSTTITLDPNTTYQTFQNWEATDFNGNIDLPEFGIYGFNPPVMQQYKDVLADMAVNDLGINRVRLEIMSGAENPSDSYTSYINGQVDRTAWKADRAKPTNDNNDPNNINWNGFQFSFLDHKIDTVVLPLKQKLEANGEELYINLNYVDFDSSPFEHTKNPDEYAEFILATFLHMKDKYGWVPDAVEVLLEPNNSPDVNPTDVGNMLVAAAERLQANGYTPDFIAPSHAFLGIPFFDNMVTKVPDVLDYLSEFAYHCYNFCQSDDNLRDVAVRGTQYDIRTSHLEHIGHNYLDLHRDLKLANVSAWAQYTLAGSYGGDGGGDYYFVDISDQNNPVVTMQRRTKFLRQYMKFIKPDSVRIKADSSNTAFDPVAFINADGKYVVVIKASSGGDITLRDLPAGMYGIKYTTDRSCAGVNVLDYDVDQPDVTISAGGTINTNIPTCGVITVYAKTSSGATPTATTTSMPEPSSTATSTATSMPEPSSTATSTATSMPEPSSTATSTATSMPDPGSTATSTSTVTPTLEPGSTATSTSTATSMPEPGSTATSIPKPSSTPTATATQTAACSPTAAMPITNTRTPTPTQIPGGTLAAPGSVILSGATRAPIYSVQEYTAKVEHLSLTMPVTYEWRVTEQATTTRIGANSDTIAIEWDSPGAKLLSVTATSEDGVTDATLSVDVIGFAIYLPQVNMECP